MPLEKKDEWDLEMERMPWRFKPQKPNIREALLHLRALGYHAEADIIAGETQAIQKARAREAEAYILLSAVWPTMVRIGRTDIADQISDFLSS
jgi:hypothetical protein